MAERLRCSVLDLGEIPAELYFRTLASILAEQEAETHYKVIDSLEKPN